MSIRSMLAAAVAATAFAVPASAQTYYARQMLMPPKHVTRCPVAANHYLSAGTGLPNASSLAAGQAECEAVSGVTGCQVQYNPYVNVYYVAYSKAAPPPLGSTPTATLYAAACS